MVEYYLQPVRSVMAGVAGFICHYMICPLAGGNGLIMTSLAGGRGFIMGKRYYHRFPYIRRMASLTLFASDWMSCRFVSSDTDTIMATCCVTRLPGHGTVVEHHLQPIGGVVAYITR